LRFKLTNEIRSSGNECRGGSFLDERPNLKREDWEKKKVMTKNGEECFYYFNCEKFEGF
jgi:hypothetical protein